MSADEFFKDLARLIDDRVRDGYVCYAIMLSWEDAANLQPLPPHAAGVGSPDLVINSGFGKGEYRVAYTKELRDEWVAARDQRNSQSIPIPLNDDGSTNWARFAEYQRNYQRTGRIDG